MGDRTLYLALFDMPPDRTPTIKPLLLPFRIIYCLYACGLFVLIMFLIIPFVIAGSFLSKRERGNFIYRMCAIWGTSWCFLVGIFHRNIFDAPHDRSKQYIFIANHISYMDPPLIVNTIRQPVRVLGKSEMGNIPFFGYIYKRAIITVNRSSPEWRAKSVRELKSVIRKNISIFMFPEGTFNETGKPLKDFYDGAFRIAIETQTPIKPLLFLDAHDRLHYKSLLTLNPGISRSLFLEEINVKGMTLKDVPRLKQQAYAIMEQKLVEYKASWILP